MHINIVHILLAVSVGAVAAFSRGKNGKINLKAALALSALAAIVVVIVDWFIL